MQKPGANGNMVLWVASGVIWLVERGLDIMGWTNPSVAVMIWCVAAIILWWAACTTQWTHNHFNKITNNIYVRCFIGAIIISAFSWWSGALSRDSSFDPELKENKIVRVTSLNSPKGSNSILIEFGVDRLPTDGICCGVVFKNKPINHTYWIGLPHRTDKQHDQLALINGQVLSSDDGLIQTTIRNINISPSQSYYLYAESDKPIEIKQIWYFALINHIDLARPTRDKIGFAYTRYDN